CNHVHGDRDPGEIAGPKLLDQILRLLAGRLISNLLTELVALAKLLAHDVDDVLGMGVVLRKDQGFGKLPALWVEIWHQLVPKSLDDSADLVLGDDPTIQLLGRVGDVLVCGLPPHPSRPPISVANDRFCRCLYRATPLSNLGPDPVDLEIDIDAIGDRFLMGVLHDEVLVEKPESVFGGRSCKADEEGVKVLQDLAPNRVDRFVALVDDDEIEELRGNRWVVGNGYGLSGEAGWNEFGTVLLFLLGNAWRLFGPGQHGVEPLDGRDNDLGRGADRVRRQALNVIQLVELPVVIRSPVALEFFLRLLAEV